MLANAAFVGAGIGLALGAGLMVAGLGQAAIDHSRAEGTARTAVGGHSDAALQQDAGAMRLVADYDAFGTRRARLTAAEIAEAKAAAPARDLDCLTEAVYFEARGESPRGQAAVAQVVLNRVKNPRFPKTVCAVVFQGAASRGCQFSFACDGSRRRGRDAGAWSRARRVAGRALSGVVLSEVGGATHFHTTAVDPAWGPQMLRVAQVGLHVFYRFNPRARPTPTPAEAEPGTAVMTSLPAAPPLELRLASFGDKLDTELVQTTPEPEAQAPPPSAASPPLITPPQAPAPSAAAEAGESAAS